MSGNGVLTVRSPRSLIEELRAATAQQGIDIHEGARRVISYLPTLSQDDLKSLADPPRELETLKISLYVGWRSVDALAAATRNCSLTNSTILRRLIYGLLVTKQLEFVQRDGQMKLHFVTEKTKQEIDFTNTERELLCR
jgi:hypothetical protein